MMLKLYWQKRTHRELMLMLAALPVFILVILYFGLLWPMQTKLDNIKANVQSQQSLLTWMQQMAPIVKANRVKSVQDNRELFSIIQSHFQSKPIINKLYISRLTEKRISINFKDITFNDLLKEIVFLKRQYNIQVDELQVNRLATEGLVEGRVIVTK